MRYATGFLVRMAKDSGYQGKAISPLYVVLCVAHLAIASLSHKECLDSTIHITVYCPNARQSLGS